MNNLSVPFLRLSMLVNGFNKTRYRRVIAASDRYCLFMDISHLPACNKQLSEGVKLFIMVVSAVSSFRRL